jgi:hypothetical protein
MEKEMKPLLKFGVVLIIFGLVMSILTTVFIRANAVPKSDTNAASVTLNADKSPANPVQKP